MIVQTRLIVTFIRTLSGYVKIIILFQGHRSAFLSSCLRTVLYRFSILEMLDLITYIFRKILNFLALNNVISLIRLSLAVLFSAYFSCKESKQFLIKFYCNKI